MLGKSERMEAIGRWGTASGDCFETETFLVWRRDDVALVYLDPSGSTLLNVLFLIFLLSHRFRGMARWRGLWLYS